MNMSAPQPPSTPRVQQSRDPSGPPNKEATPHNHSARDDFERALQSRQQQQEKSGENGDEAPGDSAAAAWMSALPAPLPARAAALPTSLRSAAPAEEPSGTRAAVEASLTACPGQAVTPLTGTDPAALWEVSVHESNAVPIQLRAERTGGTETQRAWGLTIEAPAANVELMVRHAPRLNERLRKHAIGLDHVRIEQQGDKEDQ